MKLILAIVNKNDAQSVQNSLIESGIQATKLATTGGFLTAGNTTFLIGTENEDVDKVINIIANHSKKRRQTISAYNTFDSHDASASIPIEITVGGATIFVMNIERFEKI